MILFFSFFKMSKSLFIGSVSWGTTEQDLLDHISAVAPVVSVKIPTDRFSGKAKGFAFVDMESEEGAQDVIAQLNEQELDGRSLHISIAREQQHETEPCKLYVAGLPETVTEEILIEYLSSAGAVNNVSIVFDRDTGKSRGFAFIDTATEEDSDSIIDACNNSKLEGNDILVRKSRPQKEKPNRRFNNH